MLTETITYDCDGLSCHGYLAAPNAANSQKKPGIVIAHAWRGQDDFARQKAQALAELGYVALAADLYGHGKVAANNDDALQLMLPLFLDRQLLRRRINAAVETLKTHPLADANAIGAIGFCFGGLTVIELLRSGSAVRGVVSFHGLLGHTLGEYKAAPAPDAKIKGALLMLHGNDDPSVSAADITAAREEFTRKGVDWQMHLYGHTMHAFTNPEANEPHNGLAYNAKADKRSWTAMRNFFSEILT